MDLELKDKNVFISASSNGIGLATAEGFLKEGASVIINVRIYRKERANATIWKIRGSRGYDFIFVFR